MKQNLMLEKMTIREIKELLEGDLSQQYIDELQRDLRVGVKKLIQSHLQKKRREAIEQDRLEQMWRFERIYMHKGHQFIAGVDEVGRGPLAGPVVAAAVILPSDFDVTGMNDSKKITPRDRMKLRSRIEEYAIAIGVGIVDVAYIEQHNILQATYEAMRIALSQLVVTPEVILVDAVKIPRVTIPQQNIIKGDERSHSIAAASIIAKTTRDEWMSKISHQYPEYGFDQHVGYGTPKHLEAIEKWGPTPIHRMTFAPLSGKVKVRE